jgi:hypothetical protein
MYLCLNAQNGQHLNVIKWSVYPSTSCFRLYVHVYTQKFRATVRFPANLNITAVRGAVTYIYRMCMKSAEKLEHKFHTPKEEIMFISTWVRKHSCTYIKCSKCPP